MTAARPLCKCHGEPMYWNPKRDQKAGGWWKCSVAHKQDARDRYDRDPVYRIGKNLHDHARRRKQTLTRRRDALGALPE